MHFWLSFKVLLFSGKQDTPLEQRLIECEKALLNTLELGANIPTDFMQNPDINPTSFAILQKMELYIVDANFRSLYIPTLPALVANDSRHNHNNESKKDNEQDAVDVMKGDQEQESDRSDSVRKFFNLIFQIWPALLA